MGLEKVVEKIKSVEEDEILGFSKVISTLKNEDKKVSLYDFELYFLPYILGEIDKTDVNTAVYIDNFLRVAKSHHIGLAVYVDDKVVYKLPPLIADTDITKLDNISFGSIVSKVNIYSGNNPRKASTILNKVSEKIMEDLDLGESSKEYLKELIKIFNSYPDRFKKVMAKKGKDVKLDTNEVEEDLFDY